jgi:hypothetical protein
LRPDPGAASANASSHAQGGFAADAGRITRLAWPVFIGQISVLAFSTVDTLLVARYSAQDLAALAVGAAAYVTVFIGFMGVVLAISPIVGQLQGAGRLHDAGRQVHQAIWVGPWHWRCWAPCCWRFPGPSWLWRRPRPNWKPRSGPTCWRWPVHCQRRCCSPSTGASTTRCRDPRR